jgi:hypothetical protein
MDFRQPAQLDSPTIATDDNATQISYIHTAKVHSSWYDYMHTLDRDDRCALTLKLDHIPALQTLIHIHIHTHTSHTYRGRQKSLLRMHSCMHAVPFQELSVAAVSVLMIACI